MNRIGQTHEQAPPIVDQSNDASEQPAALQVLCREPAPAPLVFQFVEPVLAVRPIAIQLTQGSPCSEVTSAAYSQTSRLPATSARLSCGSAGCVRSDPACDAAGSPGAAGSNPSAAGSSPCLASPGRRRSIAF